MGTSLSGDPAQRPAGQRNVVWRPAVSDPPFCSWAGSSSTVSFRKNYWALLRTSVPRASPFGLGVRGLDGCTRSGCADRLSEARHRIRHGTPRRDFSARRASRFLFAVDAEASSPHCVVVACRGEGQREAAGQAASGISGAAAASHGRFVGGPRLGRVVPRPEQPRRVGPRRGAGASRGSAPGTLAQGLDAHDQPGDEERPGPATETIEDLLPLLSQRAGRPSGL